MTFEKRDEDTYYPKKLHTTHDRWAPRRRHHQGHQSANRHTHNLTDTWLVPVPTTATTTKTIPTTIITPATTTTRLTTPIIRPNPPTTTTITPMVTIKSTTNYHAYVHQGMPAPATPYTHATYSTTKCCEQNTVDGDSIRAIVPVNEHAYADQSRRTHTVQPPSQRQYHRHTHEDLRSEHGG